MKKNSLFFLLPEGVQIKTWIYVSVGFLELFIVILLHKTEIFFNTISIGGDLEVFILVEVIVISQV